MISMVFCLDPLIKISRGSKSDIFGFSVIVLNKDSHYFAIALTYNHPINIGIHLKKN